MESSIRKAAEEFWNTQSVIDAQKNRHLRHQHGRGPCNIFILDTSSSLGEQGFTQMRKAFTSIIDEYEKHPEIDENVAVIICGRQTKFQSYYSNHYWELKQALDNVEFGGPSPLTAAFILSRESLQRNVSRSYRMGEFHIHPRIILISGGKPTDFSEPINDGYTENGTQLDTNHLLNVAMQLGRIHPIFCIPVGTNPDLIILEFISAQSRGGRMINAQESEQLAKYSHNIMISSKLTFSMENDGHDRERVLTSLVCSFPNNVFTEMDQMDIFEICSKKSLYISLEEIIDTYVERDPRMPPLGSRVKRGRDWEYTDDKENVGTGTVIGHSKEEGWLNVEWDTGLIRMHRYGTTDSEKDKFDVQVCDNPRILQNELIATGCLVTRGPDWVWNDQDGGAGNIGSVIRVESDGSVLVQWERGCRKPMGYRFGCDGRFEVQICDPLSAEAIKHLRNLMSKDPLNSHVEDATCDNKDCNHVSDTSIGKNADTTNRPMLQISKGKYFKNETMNESSTEVHRNGPTDHRAIMQWFWKNGNEGWVPYSREMNDRINKAYKRDPNSTVVVTVKDQLVVIAKSKQINLETREVAEVKLIKNDSPI